MKHITQQVVHTKREFRISLTGADIVAAIACDAIKIPDNARVHFRVPGGGDWSNMSLDIDDETPVFIEWSEEDTQVLP